MPLVSKATATITLKNGKVKLNKGYREVHTSNGKIMYFTEDSKKKVSKKKVVEEVVEVDEEVKEESLTVEM